MSPEEIAPDEQRPSELLEGLMTVSQFRKTCWPSKKPPTERTIYRWMERGWVAWVPWGRERLIDVPGTRELTLARVRRPDRERRRRGRKR
jgi:hypothetical protein